MPPNSGDRVDAKQQNLYLWGLEVHLDQDVEAQLNELAMKTGRGTEELVQQAVYRMLEYDADFLEAVEKGRASARRGDLLEHDEVVERIERMFHT